MSMGIKVLYDWILQSNRPAHAKAGMFIFDWLDALATVLLPGLITVFSILVVTL